MMPLKPEDIDFNELIEDIENPWRFVNLSTNDDIKYIIAVSLGMEISYFINTSIPTGVSHEVDGQYLSSCQLFIIYDIFYKVSHEHSIVLQQVAAILSNMGYHQTIWACHKPWIAWSIKAILAYSKINECYDGTLLSILYELEPLRFLSI